MTLRAPGSLPPTIAGPSTLTPYGLPIGPVPDAFVPIRFPSTSVPSPATRMPPVRLAPITLPGAAPGVEVSPPMTTPDELPSSLIVCCVIGRPFWPDGSTPSQLPSTVVFGDWWMRTP